MHPKNRPAPHAGRAIARRPRAAATASLVLAAATAATATPHGTASDPPGRHETRDAASAPGRPAAVVPGARGPAGRIVFGDFTSIQVNLDAAGLDVVGDAGNEPSIAIDPTAPNRMAVGWRQFDTIASSFRQAGYAWSEDGGRTWQRGPGASIIEPGVFRSDPVLAALPDGRFCYLSLEVTAQNDFFCDVFVSDDGGRTWPTKTFAYGGDKAWIVVDPTDGPGAGNAYSTWNLFGNQYSPNQANRSFDPTSSFDEPVPYLPDTSSTPIFGQCAIGPDGELAVAGREAFDASTASFARSSTPWAGATGPVFDLVTPLDLGGAVVGSDGPNPGGLLGQVEVAIDPSDGPRRGWIYVLATVRRPGGDPLDVVFTRSEDGGATWTEPVRVHDAIPSSPGAGTGWARWACRPTDASTWSTSSPRARAIPTSAHCAPAAAPTAARPGRRACRWARSGTRSWAFRSSRRSATTTRS